MARPGARGCTVGVVDLNTLYHRTVESWADRVNAVGADQWDWPTPCREWTVRDLTNHVAGEDLWTTPLVQGSTIEEVGDRFDGDLLGDDPILTALGAAAEATRSVARALPEHGTVHLSYGEETIDEYVHQLAADHLVHGWDLAVATGGDPRLDPALVVEVAAWFADREDLYRQAGMVGAAQGRGRDAQGDLLAAFGRDPPGGSNHAALARFSAALGAGDVDRVRALMTDDCDGRGHRPAPDGAAFTEEESFVAGTGACCAGASTGPADGGSDGPCAGSTSCGSATAWSARSTPTSRADLRLSGPMWV